MKKLIFCLVLILAALTCVFAGDVAQYADLGFSPDGKYFVFAQYGVTDLDFKPYAEIYTVDVAKNDFVRNAVFKIAPGSDKSVNTGTEAFEKLYKKNEKTLSKYTGKKVSLDNTLYLRGPESKDSSAEIVFKDFNNSTPEKEIFYYVNLVKHVSRDSGLKSSFFISVERKDADGNVLSRQVAGNPDFQRKNVSDYAIRRIVSDESGKSLVFEVEKKIEDSKGVSFRYMVETMVLK